MEIVIKIDDDIAKGIRGENECEVEPREIVRSFQATIADAIANGTPLPKGHGRLIDADAYRKDMMDSQEFNFFKILDMQSTIVEADKENDNG